MDFATDRRPGGHPRPAGCRFNSGRITHKEKGHRLMTLSWFGGGGRNWTGVRQTAAFGSTCLDSVYCFNRTQPNGQDVIGEFCKNLAAEPRTYPAAIQFYMTVRQRGAGTLLMTAGAEATRW